MDCTIQGSRAPYQQLFHDLIRDVDPPLLAHFLLDEIHGENRGQVLRANRLAGARVQRGLHGVRHVRRDVIPLAGHLVFAKQNLYRHGHLPPAVCGTAFPFRVSGNERACSRMDE